MALLDQYGNPVRESSLTKEQAGGTITSVRSPYDPIVAPGLTPQKLTSLLRRAADGDHEDYLVLAAEMERRDGHYFSQLQTRKLATGQLEFCVKPVSDSEKDKSIAKEVERFIKGEEFGLSVPDILDGLAKGYSVVEILWSRTEKRWTPARFLWRNPRWFTFDVETAQELRLYNGTIEGEPLVPFKYIVHKPKVFSGLALGGGLARIVAALHLFKGYAIKDWMAFAEVFGMPIRIGKYDPGSTDADKEALKEAVRNIGSDAAAVIPKTMEIVFERAMQSGFAGSDRFFAELTDWCNKEVSKAVLGQTMTSEDGSSLSQAAVHNEVRKDIRNSDAWQFGCSVNRDLVRPFVDLNFGVQEDYPYFYPDTEDEPEDLESLSKAIVPMIDRGLPVSIASMLERFGLRMPEEDEPLLSSVAPAVEEDDESARATLARVLAELRTTTNLRHFKARVKGLLK